MLFLRVLYLISIAYCLRQYNEYCIANTVLPIALGNTMKNMKTCSTQHLLPWCCHRGSTQSASAHARLHSQTRQKNVSSCTCPLACPRQGGHAWYKVPRAQGPQAVHSTHSARSHHRAFALAHASCHHVQRGLCSLWSRQRSPRTRQSWAEHWAPFIGRDVWAREGRRARAGASSGAVPGPCLHALEQSTRRGA